MTIIQFQDVGVDIPIFNANHRSLKSSFVKMATGGKLGTDGSGHVVVRALQGLGFTLMPGDRVGLVGHNGAGKSTLLRVLAGVYAPTRGRVDIRGNVASLIDLSLGLDPESTGRENIFLRCALLGLRDKQIEQRLDEIIEFSELGDFIDMPLRTYSSGMQLRLAFAGSTVVTPDILLMDEWLSVGDENFRHKAEARLTALVEKTQILVLASHSRELVLKTCNRVLWLEHGQVQMDGSPQAVCEAYFGA